jgi:hypothetical protein
MKLGVTVLSPRRSPRDNKAPVKSRFLLHQKERACQG